MLEINQFDQTRPVAARTPERRRASTSEAAAFPGHRVSRPIATPLMFAGFNENVLRDYAPLFNELGVTAVQGGAGNALTSSKPAADWKTALQPGQTRRRRPRVRRYECHRTRHRHLQRRQAYPRVRPSVL